MNYDAGRTTERGGRCQNQFGRLQEYAPDTQVCRQPRNLLDAPRSEERRYLMQARNNVAPRKELVEYESLDLHRSILTLEHADFHLCVVDFTL